MCKYCKTPCEGDICFNCMNEQNAILWDNDECVDLNSIFAVFGLLQFVTIIPLIIIVICGFTGALCGDKLWMSIIFLSGATFLFRRLRKLYHKQIGIVIDREMRKNHS